MTLIEAIDARHSVRAYKVTPIPADIREHLDEDIHVEGITAHFIYANKMGKKYLKRYKKYFRDPDIREFDMQHEQWLFGEEEYTGPVLKVIDEFMGGGGDIQKFREVAGPAIAKFLKEEGVDGVVMTAG